MPVINMKEMHNIYRAQVHMFGTIVFGIYGDWLINKNDPACRSSTESLSGT